VLFNPDSIHYKPLLFQSEGLVEWTSPRDVLQDLCKRPFSYYSLPQQVSSRLHLMTTSLIKELLYGLDLYS